MSSNPECHQWYFVQRLKFILFLRKSTVMTMIQNDAINKNTDEQEKEKDELKKTKTRLTNDPVHSLSFFLVLCNNDL